MRNEGTSGQTRAKFGSVNGCGSKAVQMKRGTWSSENRSKFVCIESHKHCAKFFITCSLAELSEASLRLLSLFCLIIFLYNHKNQYHTLK